MQEAHTFISAEVFPIIQPTLSFQEWQAIVLGFQFPQPELERRAFYELEQIRLQAGFDSYAAARDRFTAKRSAIETLVNGALIDEPGRSNCLHHVSAFYEAAAAVVR